MSKPDHQYLATRPVLRFLWSKPGLLLALVLIPLFMVLIAWLFGAAVAFGVGVLALISVGLDELEEKRRA